MAEFTPGPWIAELGEIHEVRDTEGGRICILTQLRGRYGLGGRRADSESPANANLIAAAPEMYEALQMALAAEQTRLYSLPASDEYEVSVAKDGCSARIGRIKAVLAKAEGKSNG